MADAPDLIYADTSGRQLDHLDCPLELGCAPSRHCVECGRVAITYRREGSGPTLHEASTALQHAILAALAAVPEPGWCVGLRGLSGRTGLSREVCRAMVADLRAAGLASYHKGLWSDDDMPAGAGYAITSAGLAMLASATGENTC